jgi:hypothetical protein
MPRIARQTLEKASVESAPDKEQPVAPQELGTIVKASPRRRKKNVFNGTALKLSVQKTIPGYHLHVFTDHGNRIYEAEENGYEFVSPEEIGGVSENVVSRNGDLGNRVRFLVNPRAEGSQQFGYLMKLRNEWWEEDEAARQEKPNMIDANIKKGQVAGENPAFYKPRGSDITIKSEIK